MLMSGRPISFFLINSITLYRLLAAPFLVWLAVSGRVDLFKWFLGISFTTDALDGFLSRRYKVDSVFGARLDSIADDATVLAAIISLWITHPEFFQEHWNVVVGLLVLFAFQNILALLVYHRLTSFHTYLAKAAAVLQAVFFLLLFFDLSYVDPFFYAAAITTGVQLIEEIALIFILPEWKSDVKGLFWVIQNRNRDRHRA